MRPKLSLPPWGLLDATAILDMAEDASRWHDHELHDHIMSWYIANRSLFFLPFD